MMVGCNGAKGLGTDGAVHGFRMYELGQISQHQFRSARRAAAREIKDRRLLDLQLENAQLRHRISWNENELQEKSVLLERLSEAEDELKAWASWWAEHVERQQALSVEQVLSALTKGDHEHWEADTRNRKDDDSSDTMPTTGSYVGSCEKLTGDTGDICYDTLSSSAKAATCEESSIENRVNASQEHITIHAVGKVGHDSDSSGGTNHCDRSDQELAMQDDLELVGPCSLAAACRESGRRGPEQNSDTELQEKAIDKSFDQLEHEFDCILNLVDVKVDKVMKIARGTWPSWPPPPEVNVDAVTESAVAILMSGSDLSEFHAQLLHRRVRFAVEGGFAKWESFALSVRGPDTDSAAASSCTPASLSSGLAGVTKRGMPQPRRRKR